MASNNGWTPTQRRMLEVLGDGMWHSYYELFACLDDELSGNTAVAAHLARIKEKLETLSQGIAMIKINGTLHYQHVRLISGPDS